MRRRLPVVVLALILASALSRAEAACIPGSQSTVFNASHDLHKVWVKGVRYPNVEPNKTSVDSAPGLNAAVTYVVGNTACRQLTLDSGSYDFRALIKVGGRQTYLYVNGGTDLSIDFRNAQFLFKESYFSALTVENCVNCNIRGFSIDYVHLPFTELAVTKVSEQHRFILAVPLSATWPNPEQLYRHQASLGPVLCPSAPDPKTQSSLLPLCPPEVAGFDTRGGTPLYADTDWQIALPLPEPHRIPLDPEHVIAEGDIFIIAVRGGGPAIYAKNDRADTFKDITIFTSGGPAIESWYSDGMVFLGITVAPGTGRLVSTVAGGIQFDAMTGPGNRVQNSLIDGVQDDSIAGYPDTQSASVATASTAAVTLTSAPPLSPVFFVNGLTGNVVAGPPGQGRALFAAGPQTYEVVPHLTAREARLVAPGGVAFSTAQFQPTDTLVVAHNRIANSYLARGIALSGVVGAEITRNTISNTQQAGIYLGTAPPQFGPANDALIAENILTATNMGMSGVGTDMLGAIEVMAFGSNGNVFGGQPTRKVFINHNTVMTTERTGIWVGNVAEGEIDSANVISDYGLSHGNLGLTPHLNDGLQPYAPIAFKRAVFGWCTRKVSGLTLGFCHPPPAL